MIPLRDANPTHRTPVVTLTIIVACFVAFAWELGLLATSDAALDAFIVEWGVVPADLSAALGRGDDGGGALYRAAHTPMDGALAGRPVCAADADA